MFPLQEDINHALVGKVAWRNEAPIPKEGECCSLVCAAMNGGQLF